MARLTLDWLHVIALLGAVQGLVLAGALFAKRSNRAANRLLAVLMVSFSIFLTTAIYHGAGLERQFPHFFGIGYPLLFLFGPLVYLYAVCAADRSRRLTRRDAWHFVPFAASVVLGLPVYLSSGAEKIAFYQQLQQGVIPLYVRIQDVAKLISGVTYATATLVFLLRHRERVKASYSSTERVNLRWLLWLGATVAAIWMLAVVFEVLESAGVARIPRQDDYIGLGIAAVVYIIGYMGLRQPEIFRFETAEYPVAVAANADALGSAQESAAEAEARYERSGLSDREAARLESALLSVMQRDRPWTDSDLTLADLAERLGTTSHNLSEVLNAQLGQSFYDFVNGYRVREVQRRIAAGEGRALKILSLALDAGFASKSTFNQVFKKHTSQTPSDFLRAAGT